jgi:hypothetical protein
MMHSPLDLAIVEVLHGKKLNTVAIYRALEDFLGGCNEEQTDDAIKRLLDRKVIRKVAEKDGYYEVPRKTVPDRDLLAMFIYLWRDGERKPAVDLEWAKTATAREVIDRFRATHQIDHYPLFRAWGGKDHHSNYFPRKTAEHIKKTAERDARELAKVRAKEKEQAEKEAQQAEFRRTVLAKPDRMDQTKTDESRPRPKRVWPKRGVNYKLFDGTPVRAGERRKKKD